MKKKKSNGKQQETQQGVIDVQAEPVPATQVAEKSDPLPVADGSVEAAPCMPPDVMPPPGRPLDEIGHEWGETDQRLRDEENDLDRIKKDYGKRIGLLEARCAELAQEYRAAERPISYDYHEGWKYIWDGKTGKLLERVRLEPMTQVPLDEVPKKKSRKAKKDPDADSSAEKPGEAESRAWIFVGAKGVLPNGEKFEVKEITDVGIRVEYTDGDSFTWNLEDFDDCKPCEA